MEEWGPSICPLNLHERKKKHSTQGTVLVCQLVVTSHFEYLFHQGSQFQPPPPNSVLAWNVQAFFCFHMTNKRMFTTVQPLVCERIKLSAVTGRDFGLRIPYYIDVCTQKLSSP